MPDMHWLTADEWSVLALSARVAAMCVLVLAVPGIALGWLLARREFRGKAILDALLHAPLVMPPVVTGYLLLMLFGRRGVVGAWLYNHFGITFAFTFKAAVIASACMALPLMVRAVRLSVELVDRKLEDAARTLGASPLRTFVTITLPLAFPGVLTGLILSFARSLGEFGATIVFAGNISGETRTLPLAIYTSLQVPGAEDAAMRLVVISLILALGALIASEWFARRMRGFRETGP
jgi:molybdate transport system permease protein